MVTGRLRLARRQQQSLLAVLCAAVIAIAIALAMVRPIRTLTEPAVPVPVSLVTAELNSGPSSASSEDQRSALGANLWARHRNGSARAGALAAGVGTEGADDPPVTVPPTTDPPVTVPPTTDPTVTVPPTTDPTVTLPPTTDPTVTVPPTTDPSITFPPIPPKPGPPPTVTLPPDPRPIPLPTEPPVTIMPPCPDGTGSGPECPGPATG